MNKYGVAGVALQQKKWQIYFADSSGYRSISVEEFNNDRDGITELINSIILTFKELKLDSSRVLLVDNLPNVHPIFYDLATHFSSPLVVSCGRLRMHETRLGRRFKEIAELAAEAYITGFRTETLLIETTNVCTFRCLYCPQDEVTRDTTRIPLDKAKEIISEYAHHSLGTIGFHVMGEPCTNPDIIEIVRHTAKFKIGHALTTNASVLTKEKSIALFKNGLHHIIISMQSFTEEQHVNFKRPAPKYTYSQTLQNIKDCIQAKWAFAPEARLEIHVMDNSTYQPRDVKIVTCNNDATDVVSFWSNIVKQLYGSNKYDIQSAPNDLDLSQLCWPLGDYEIAPNIYVSFKKAGNWIQNFIKEDEYIIPSIGGNCKAINHFLDHRQLAILANGDAIMCCFDFNGQTKFANIFKTSLKDIDDQAERLRKQLVNSSSLPFTVCKRCQGIRIVGYDNNFRKRKKNDIVHVKNIAFYGSTKDSIEIQQKFCNIGIKTTIHNIENKNQRQAIDSISADIEAIIFPPNWQKDQKLINHLMKIHPTLLVGSVDPIALNPYKALIGEENDSRSKKKSSSNNSFLCLNNSIKFLNKFLQRRSS